MIDFAVLLFGTTGGSALTDEVFSDIWRISTWVLVLADAEPEVPRLMKLLIYIWSDNFSCSLGSSGHFAYVYMYLRQCMFVIIYCSKSVIGQKLSSDYWNIQTI